MKITHNIKAISKLLLILLLLLAMIIGSIFSYMIIVGYYLNLESNIPDNPVVSITDVNFDPHNAATFNVTVLNPTYSTGEVSIKEIYIATTDDTLHLVSNAEPQLPAELKKGEQETFICTLNWGNFTGQTVKVIIIVEDGSGSTHTIKTDPAKLEIIPVFSRFNLTQFNLTLNNPTTSTVDLTVTDITLTTEDTSVFDVDLIDRDLPQLFIVGTQSTFQCSWNWTDYMNTTIAIKVFTLQNITFYHTELLPDKSHLSITNVTFNTNDTSSFNMTAEISNPNINITTITNVGVNLENLTIIPLTVEPVSALPYDLAANETITFKVMWNWEPYRGETVIVGIDTQHPYTQVLYSGYTFYTIP